MGSEERKMSDIDERAAVRREMSGGSLGRQFRVFIYFLYSFFNIFK